MRNKPTQHSLIQRYCEENDGWIPSYDMVKVTLFGHWVGTRGDRTARDLAIDDIIHRKDARQLISEGIETDYKDRPIQTPYTYYRAKHPKTKVIRKVMFPEGIKEIVAYE